MAVVEVDRFLVVGEGRDGTTGQARLPGVARVVLEDLLAGEDPQLPVGESGGTERCGGPFGLVGVGEDGDEEALRVEDQRPVGRGPGPGRSCRPARRCRSSAMAVGREGVGEGLVDRGRARRRACR